MVQNYSQGKLMDTKALEGVAFSVEDFRVLLILFRNQRMYLFYGLLPFFFMLIGLESQFQGYQHRICAFEWLDLKIRI